MAIDKVLHKIQSEIHELAPLLEVFVHENIQASTEDCEKLQHHLTRLQEDLAVYKYNKQNKELSPSFNIHAKLSEQSVKEEKVIEVVAKEEKVEIKITEEVKIKEEPKVEEVIKVKAEIKEETPEPKKPEVISPKIPLTIGLNDKFRFLNELFSQNNSEYNIAFEQLSNLSNWGDTELYLNSLKTLYGWKENNETVKHLFSLAKQRFR